MENKEISLKDYTPSNYLIESVDLTFEIKDEFVLVTNELKMFRNKNADLKNKTLTLNGEEIELVSVTYNGSDLKEYKHENDLFSFHPSDESFIIKFTNKVMHKANTKLMGLYQSGSIICTQCEAEGFRRITFFLDRPDVLTKFKTTIIADEKKYPHLLSNGNLIHSSVESGLKTCVWEDPFKKPAYLFALVAGDLDLARDEYITKSGRKVNLEIYVDKGKLDQVDHAMNSLKQSMKWDEDRFDLEYDLDIYMIVAVDSFNMGAMENKGLNVFNSKYVLGNSVTATDSDYFDIQAVIGHEYFHNWTGNRVTCRDWFQLTLKEGLTVFRDREFSSDLNSRAVKRIDDVQNLRGSQFVEDAGPFSHPIKPKSYLEINNFYTSTIYEKGAEVIGMIHTIIGEESFQKGMKEYFKLFDGTAATTENFIHAMELGSGYDFTYFKNWYDVSGTPSVSLNVLDGSISVKTDASLEMPFKFKFLGANNKYKLIADRSEIIMRNGQEILILRDKEVTFQTDGKALLSFNREFSVPIKLHRNDNILDLIKHDDDQFSLWDYGQALYINSIIENFEKSIDFPKEILEVCKFVLTHDELDDHFKSYFLSIPSVSVISEKTPLYKFEEVNQSRRALIKMISENLSSEISSVYKDASSKDKNIWNDQMMGHRALKNRLLSFMTDEEIVKDHYFNSVNMTNRLGALALINARNFSSKDEANKNFEQECETYDQLIPAFISSRARQEIEIIDNAKKLETHELFNHKIPNHLYRLYGTLMSAHLAVVYKEGSELLEYLLEKICEIDSYNPQVASRFFKLLKNPSKFSGDFQKYYLGLLKGLTDKYKLSNDSIEIVLKFLK